MPLDRDPLSSGVGTRDPLLASRYRSGSVYSVVLGSLLLLAIPTRWQKVQRFVCRIAITAARCRSREYAKLKTATVLMPHYPRAAVVILFPRISKFKLLPWRTRELLAFGSSARFSFGFQLTGLILRDPKCYLLTLESAFEAKLTRTWINITLCKFL